MSQGLRETERRMLNMSIPYHFIVMFVVWIPREVNRNLLKRGYQRYTWPSYTKSL